MSDDYGIKPEWREAWHWIDRYQGGFGRDVADLTLHLLARLLESEFRREHGGCKASQMVSLNPDRKWIEWSCKDPRHDYDWPKWVEAAQKFLSERRDDE